MKPIKLYATGATDAIREALDSVNGRATSYTVCRARDVFDVADQAESRLESAGVPKTDRKGVRVVYRPAGPDSNSYRYQAKSTLIRLERNTVGWILTEVKESKVSPKEAETFGIHVPGHTRDAIVRKALQRFVVIE